MLIMRRVTISRLYASMTIQQGLDQKKKKKRRYNKETAHNDSHSVPVPILNIIYEHDM